MGSLRESGEELGRFEAALYGASVDRPAANLKFAQRLELPFPILSDPDKSVARAYGVLRAMGLYTARHTFYIGVDGTILHVDRDVSPGTAGADVVARLEALGVTRRD